METKLPNCEYGIGSLISSPTSTELIDGVLITPVALWPDDRGWFMEVARIGTGPVAGFEKAQASTALSYPGTIKAFHIHKLQTDYWVPVAGMFQVGLVDLRPESKTFGRRNTIYTGQLRPWSIIIPPGVAHGYKVIGQANAVLVYVTNQFYNPSDEGRIPYNDPSINYDWETQHK